MAWTAAVTLTAFSAGFLAAGAVAVHAAAVALTISDADAAATMVSRRRAITVAVFADTPAVGSTSTHSSPSSSVYERTTTPSIPDSALAPPLRSPMRSNPVTLTGRGHPPSILA